LSVSVTSSGHLEIEGSGDDERITVYENPNLSQTPHGTHQVHVEFTDEDGNISHYDFNGIDEIEINSGGGDDQIFYTGHSVGADIEAGSGDDGVAITDAGTGASRVEGNGGNDDIVIIAANATGGKTVVRGGSGRDNIQGNTDNGSNRNTADSVIEIWGDDGDDTITLYDGTATIFGGNGKDILIIEDDVTLGRVQGIDSPIAVLP
jgi:hypothetical protein